MTTGAEGDAAARSAPVARRGSARRGLLTEGPRWDAERDELLWVDILAGELHTATVGDDGQLEPVRTLQVGRHVGAAAPAAAGGYVLAAADRGWLAQLVTRRVGLEQVQTGLQRSAEDIKVIVEMTR